MSEGSAAVTGAERRYEIKLVCDAGLLAQARTWIRQHPALFRSAYPSRLVHNLYLDTPGLNSFGANLAGISTRQKLRLRWYGERRDVVVHPVLELKRKENMLGDKKRQTLACELDWQRPYRHILRQVQEAAAADWQPWLQAATQPALINRYRRDYFATADGVLRATLDYGLQAYDQRLAARPNRTRPLPLPDVVIIEVKAPLDHLPRLQEAMGHFPLPRMRSSKYANSLLAAL